MKARRIIAVLSAIVLAAYCTTSARAATTGTWSIEPSSASGEISFGIRLSEVGEHDEDSTSDINLDEFSGLTRLQLEANGAHVAFTLTREAGTFHCDGWAQGGHASGTFTFDSNPQYISAMSALGYHKLADHDLFVAAMLNITPSYVGGLRDAGYQNIPFEQLIPLRALGIDRAYIAGLASMGYTHVSTSQMITLKALNIDAAYVARVKAHGIKQPSIEDLVRLKAMNII